MKKILLIIAVTIISFSCFAINTLAEEDDFTSKKPMTEEEVYKGMGYSKDLSKIINIFEEKLEYILYLRANGKYDKKSLIRIADSLE